MVEAATWRIDPEHLDASARELREYMDEDGASVLVRIDGEWLPILEIDGENAEAQTWEGAADGIGIEGDCSTTLSMLPDVEPGDIRLTHDETVDGLVLWVGKRPVLAVAGEELQAIPSGLLHLEAADLPAETLSKVCASRPGKDLVSLDVGGHDDFSSEESPAFLGSVPAGIRELSISDFESLTDLRPLTKLASLTHLHLDGCTSLQDLSPLSGLAKLESLDLSGCTSVSDLGPLSDLPIAALSLEGFPRPPDLAPLVRILTLATLDLSDCEALASVAVLRACTNLRELDLTGCPKVEDVQALSGCTNLRRLEIDDPVLATRVLAAAAVKRVDPGFVEQHIEQWLEQVSEDTDLVDDLLPAVTLGKAEPWAVDALEQLVQVSRRAGLDRRSTWQPLLDALLAAGDPDMRRGVELAVTDLAPGTSTSAVVVPALDVLARAPDSARKWAQSLADRTLDALVSTPRATEIASDALRFYAKTGRPEALDPWLDLVGRGASAPEPPPRSEPKPGFPSIEDDPALLSGLVARLVQKQPDSPPVSQLVAALVGLARDQPDSPTIQPFADYFQRAIHEQPEGTTPTRLVDTMASVLVGQPDSAPAKRITGQIAEMVKMQPDNPRVQNLMEEVLHLITERPDSPAVAPITQMLDAARDAGVGVFARKVIEHPALRAKADRKELETFAGRFDGRHARRAMIRGLVDELCAEDIVRNKPRSAVVAAIEEDLVDVD